MKIKVRVCQSEQVADLVSIRYMTYVWSNFSIHVLRYYNGTVHNEILEIMTKQSCTRDKGNCFIFYSTFIITLTRIGFSLLTNSRSEYELTPHKTIQACHKTNLLQTDLLIDSNMWKPNSLEWPAYFHGPYVLHSISDHFWSPGLPVMSQLELMG